MPKAIAKFSHRARKAKRIRVKQAKRKREIEKRKG